MDVRCLCKEVMSCSNRDGNKLADSIHLYSHCKSETEFMRFKAAVNSNCVTLLKQGKSGLDTRDRVLTSVSIVRRTYEHFRDKQIATVRAMVNMTDEQILGLRGRAEQAIDFLREVERDIKAIACPPMGSQDDPLVDW